MKDKLKALKGFLKSLNHQVFGTLDSHITSLLEEVSYLDVRAKWEGLLMEKIYYRKKVISDL